MSILDDSLNHLENTSTSPRKVGKQRFPINPLILGAVALVSVLGVYLSVNLSQQSQDVRNQASTNQGQVILSASSSPSPLKVGQPAVITFKANTQGVLVDGIQLSYTLNSTQSQPLSTAPTVAVVAGSGVTSILGLTTTTTANGSFQQVFGAFPTIPNSFSSTTPTDFVTISFTPTAVGTLTFEFDNVVSKATIKDSPTGTDTLLTIQPISFVVEAVTTPTSTVTQTATPTLTSTSTIAPTSTINATPTLTVTNTPTITATAVPTATIAPTATSILPTATSVAGTCNSIMISYVSTDLPVTAPMRGEVIHFTCGMMNGAARYEFRLREPNSSTYINLNPVADGARVSVPYTITQAGDFSGQCRMCTDATGTSCQPWE